MLCVLLHVRWDSHETVRKQQMPLKGFNLHLYVISLVASRRLGCPFILLWKPANEPCDGTNMIIGKFILRHHSPLYASHAVDRSPKRTGERHLCKFRQSHASISFMIFTLVMVWMFVCLQNWCQILLLSGTTLSCDCKLKVEFLNWLFLMNNLTRIKSTHGYTYEDGFRE